MDVKDAIGTEQNVTLRPIYTDELPGSAAHDSLFVLLRGVILRLCTARQLLDAIKQTKNRARLLLATQCRLAFIVELTL